MTRPGTAPAGGAGWRLLELLALSGFAVTQPVLASFGTSPDTFIVRDASRWDIVAFALIVAFLGPVVLWAVELLVGWCNRRAAELLHLGFVAVLAALVTVQIAKRGFGSQGFTALLTAAGGAAIAVLAVVRWPLVRSFLRVAAFGPLLFVVVFVAGSDVSPLLEAAPSAATGRASVGTSSAVVVVFDEWPTTSIVDAGGRIDAGLFPNLAAFADGATWYRNATSVSNSTRYAVPAILTGRLQTSDLLPVASSQPHNLFSLFEPTHRLEVFESVTGLCAAPQCHHLPTSGSAGLGGLLADAGDVYRSMISPSGERTDPTTQFVEAAPKVRTRDFRRLETRRQVLAGAIVNRPARFSEFLGSFHAHEPPTLHVLHLLVPHVPLRFLPSGFEYPPPVPEIGRQGDLWTDGADAVALTHQRALLQTAYLDRLVGQLTARLRATGLLDRATVVLTADHGIAYEQGQPSRALNDVDLPASLYPQLLWAPLLVHAPGQHDGRVSDANVMSIDVLPTVARLASIRIPWPVDGVPAGERDDDTKEFQRAHSDAAGGRIDPPIRFRAQAGFAAMLAANVDTVTQAGDPRWQLWRLRGRGDLVGRAVADVDVGPSSDLRVSLQQADALQHVRRASGSLPAMVWGTTDRPATVAIAVNGIVAGVSPPLGTRPGRIAAMLPDFLLHDGRNEIRIYEVPSDPTRAELRPARYLAPDAR